MPKLKNEFNYRWLLFNNRFFLILLVLTGFGIWVFFSEVDIYFLRHRGEKTIGKIREISITKENHLQVEYTYQAGQRKYIGTRYYRKSRTYKPAEIEEVVAEIRKKVTFPVYFDPVHPEKAVCFVTAENLRLNKVLGVFLGVIWLIWGLGYLQAYIWDKN